MSTKGQLQDPETRLVLGDKSVKIKVFLQWIHIDKSRFKHRFTKLFYENTNKAFNVVVHRPWAVAIIYVKWKPRPMYFTAINTLRLRENDRQFPDDIFLNESFD